MELIPLGLRRRIWLCAATGLTLLVAARFAAADEVTEASIKAAYLLKFLSYVEWPAESFAGPDAPQVVGLLEAGAVRSEFELLAQGRRVNGRLVVVRRLSPGEPLDGVHAVYIGRAARQTAWGAIPAGMPLLVVTDVPSGLPEGSALNFVMVERRVRFEASPTAAAQAGLKLSARLLAVAERVQ